MTANEQRAYVQRWIETGRILEELRWQELRRLDDAVAVAATDALIDAALMVPLPHHRQMWSGLVEQQALFHPLPNLLNKHRP